MGTQSWSLCKAPLWGQDSVTKLACSGAFTRVAQADYKEGGSGRLFSYCKDQGSAQTG